MALAGASASPAADPALLYTGVPAVGGVVAPVVGTVDTGLKFHPKSGAVTPDFTAAQKEAAPELAADQKDIKHLTYTGAVVHQPTVFHTTGYHLVGKREAEPEAKPEAEPKAEADPALLYTNGVHHIAPVVTAPAIYGGYSNIYGLGHLYGKRDAEAKSDAWGYGLPLAYGGVYSPYNIGGYHYLGKRDAEAKSDAYLGYGLPYGSVYSPYTTLGGYHYLGKRDAEAKSDAWGYGLPLAYGGVYSPYHIGGVHYLGKRDAEAKSWGYGYHGLPYGGVYGGWPYVY